jgi:hypothetical protein
VPPGVSLSVGRFFCSALLLIAAGSLGLAQQVRITVTGVVTSGIDESGVFGAPNTNLAGKDYTQVFLLDPSKGTSSVVGNPPFVDLFSCDNSIVSYLFSSGFIPGVRKSADGSLQCGYLVESREVNCSAHGLPAVLSPPFCRAFPRLVRWGQWRLKSNLGRMIT